jgi:hypothetical protein
MKQIATFLPPEIETLYREWIDREIAAAGERVSAVINESAERAKANLRESFNFASRSFGQRTRRIRRVK